MVEVLKRAAVTENKSIILIVDDDEILRRVLLLELEKRGFKVREADNGKDGLARLVEMLPDIIVTDLEMPVMDGFTFIANVRATFGKAAIPIIAISGSINEGLAERTLVAGANQFLPKPFHINSLTTAIVGHLYAVRQGCS